MSVWLHLEDIHEIQYDENTNKTVLWDVEGDERLRLLGNLSEELVHDIIRLCNRVYERGRHDGRAEKAREIRCALDEGQEHA